MQISSIVTRLAWSALGVMATSLGLGCSGPAPEPSGGTTSAYRAYSEDVKLYEKPYGVGGVDNPLKDATSVWARAKVVTDKDVADAVAAGNDWPTAPSTRVRLGLSGAPADTNFLAHVHVGDCASPAGPLGHYALGDKEIHLDFKTDGDGNGSMMTKVEFAVASGAAHSIVIHDAVEKDGGGKPAKLACISIHFNDPEAAASE